MSAGGSPGPRRSSRRPQGLHLLPAAAAERVPAAAGLGLGRGGGFVSRAELPSGSIPLSAESPCFGFPCLSCLPGTRSGVTPGEASPCSDCPREFAFPFGEAVFRPSSCYTRGGSHGQVVAVGFKLELQSTG